VPETGRCELIDDISQLVTYHDERLRIVSDELWAPLVPYRLHAHLAAMP
jgi:bifunctional pyridoxal-dependent enzyme with beta-cystathionase and maltose regulon repressor activities